MLGSGNFIDFQLPPQWKPLNEIGTLVFNEFHVVFLGIRGRDPAAAHLHHCQHSEPGHSVSWLSAAGKPCAISGYYVRHWKGLQQHNVRPIVDSDRLEQHCRSDNGHPGH